MTFSGDLTGIGLGDVFQNLNGNRATGTLHVRWERGERHVRLVDGLVAGCAAGPGRELPLLDHCVERGYADAEKVKALQANTKKRRKRPARILRDEKLCDAESIESAFREITAEGVYELLQLSAAQFVFHEGDAPPETFDADMLAAEIRMEVGPLLLEGARRADDYARIRTVVGTDQDLFVADAQAAERAPDDFTALVASLLDGRTDVAGVSRAVQRSRFEVSSALLTLVQQGLARPATGEEIAALAEEALTTEDREEAIRLLGQALVRMPREQMLRRRLAETLAAAGKRREAAGEMAVLAFQATEEERFEDAMVCYERAIALDPADVMLHQRRCEVLKRSGDKQALRHALLQWAERLENLGLADRACEVLTSSCDAGPLRNDQQLLLRCAELEKVNGNPAAAAQRYVQIVDLYGGNDFQLEVRCIRAALAAQPEDATLQKRLVDLETGRAAIRQKRRRMMLGIGAAASVAVAIVVAAQEELWTSRRLAAVLRERPADAMGTTTLPLLRQLADGNSWIPSKKLAAQVEAEESMRVLRAAEGLRLQARIDEARQALATARPSLPEAAQKRADEFDAQLQSELPLLHALQRVERRGRDDGEAFEMLARSTDPHWFDFHNDLLPRAKCDAAREALLRALQALQDPRCAESVAKAYLATRDPSIGRMCEGLIDSSARLDPERTRDALAPLLEEAREHSERRDRSVRLLEILMVHAASPAVPAAPR
ncbi:MAG: hypothetical protein RLZZ562_2027 [Planctomycetota bacterium]|jgi:tetratricopeptide (TPR) repeat protein